jgi:hypothetical protein
MGYGGPLGTDTEKDTEENPRGVPHILPWFAEDEFGFPNGKSTGESLWIFFGGREVP